MSSWASVRATAVATAACFLKRSVRPGRCVCAARLVVVCYRWASKCAPAVVTAACSSKQSARPGRCLCVPHAGCRVLQVWVDAAADASAGRPSRRLSADDHTTEQHNTIAKKKGFCNACFVLRSPGFVLRSHVSYYDRNSKKRSSVAETALLSAYRSSRAAATHGPGALPLKLTCMHSTVHWAGCHGGAPHFFPCKQ
jgi:hypothetical protein